MNSLPSPQPDGSGQLPVRDRKQRESVVIEKADLSFGADSRNRLAEAADPSADGDPDALLGNQPAIRGNSRGTRQLADAERTQVAACESGSSGHRAASAIVIGLIAVMAALNLTNR